MDLKLPDAKSATLFADRAKRVVVESMTPG